MTLNQATETLTAPRASNGQSCMGMIAVPVLAAALIFSLIEFFK